MTHAADADWWKRTTVYQIYPRSFADSNGDGIGDLRGIIEKLDYLKRLNIETLWLSPFFESPQADFGYDISNHFDVANEYGTLADCRELIDQVHARGMRIVFDMVLNHTSDKHPWFLESKTSRDNPRRDWYIWRDGRKPGGKAPPNNWRSMLGGSGWHYDAATDQWYFASFLGFQPDLNYRNPVVKATMLDVVRHWLEQGVDGLRLDIFNALFKDASFQDNPFSWRPMPTEDNPHGFFQRHHHTIDHPDTIAFAQELRGVVDEFKDPPRFLVGEVFGDAEMLKRYCGEGSKDGLHLVFLFKTLRMKHRARDVRRLVREFEEAFPDPFSPTYVFGNHDRPRSPRRQELHAERTKLRAALQLTVRGVPFIYYGEEIGMENHDMPLHEGLDPVATRFRLMPGWLVGWFRERGILLNRDECRTPMQWDASAHGGFSPEGASPSWLRMHPRHVVTNVAAQEADPRSLLACYRELLGLRLQQRALQEGILEWITTPERTKHVVAFRRVIVASAEPESVEVHLNFSRHSVSIVLPGAKGRMVFSTERCSVRELDADDYALDPYEGVIVFDKVA